MPTRGRRLAGTGTAVILLAGALASGSGTAGAVTRPTTGTAGGLVIRLGAADVVAPAAAAKPVLSSVSCPRVDACVAVGSYEGGRAIASAGEESFGRWHWSTPVRLAAGPSGSDSLSSVSCPTPTSCVAVGSDGAGVAEATSGTLVGASWRWERPTALGVDASGATRLAAVTCPTPSSCVAVGADGSHLGIASLGHRTNRVWSWSTPAPTSPAGPSSGDLVAVSCATATSCLAVGTDANGQGIVAVGSVGASRTAWSLSVLQPADSSGSGELTGLSCPTTSSCLVVGTDGDGDGTAAVWTRARGGWMWHPSRRLPGDAAVVAVACPSLRLCVAVGARAKPAAGTYATARLVNGVRTWSAPVDAPSSASGTGPPIESLAAVSCQADDACVAIGIDQDGAAIASSSRSAPAPVRDVVARGGNGRAVVTWRAPGFDGGMAIGSYRVVASPGASTCATTVTAPRTCTVEHLMNGRRYRFSVTADNGIGTSRPSLGERSVLASQYQPAVASPLTKALVNFVAARSGEVTVAVRDVSTGQTWTLDPSSVQHTASIVKVDILADLLYDHQRSAAPLSPATVQLATEMIEDSDNDAATALFNQVGQAPGLSAFNHLVGLTGTTVSYAWGFTDTTSADQVTLVSLFALPNGVLTTASRQFGLRLMRHVTPEQDWGVSSGPPTGTSVALKNGWYPTAPLAWQVNSIGWIDGGGRNYVLTVLTKDDETMGYGIETIEAISTMIWKSLDRPPPA